MGLYIGQLYPDLLFENFICDKSNSSAFTIANMIAIGNALKFPIVFYSGPGIGKTHLLHAIANEALRRDSKLKVSLISAEWLTTQLITPVQNDTIKSDLDKIREHHDIFMIDELSFLTDFADKPLVQEEVYQILKEQSANGCRIVLGSSITLNALTNWNNEFRKWLQSGEFYTINAPSTEARKLFLKRLLAKHKLTINDDLIECFHQEVGSSFRELEAAVLRVRAVANLYNTELTVEFARKTLRELAV